MATLDWDSVKSIDLVDANGNLLKTDPEIWCGGYKQWPTEIPVAVPYVVRQVGTLTSGRVQLSVNSNTEGIASITGLTASDTSTHYATVTLKDGYCWADGYPSKSRNIAYTLSKYSMSFTLTLGTKTVTSTVTGFSPDKAYGWSDMVSSGQLSSSFTVMNSVYYDGIYLHYASDDDYVLDQDGDVRDGDKFTLHTVAVPYKTGQTGGFSSGEITLNVTTGTTGISSISGTSASDTETHYATIKRTNEVCWADGSTAVSRTVSYVLSKYNVSFSIDDPDGPTYSYTVSSFDSSRLYTWSAAIAAGAIPAYNNEITVSDGIVYCYGKEVRYGGSSVRASSYIIDGAGYESYQPKYNQSYTVQFTFSDGQFYPTVSGTHAGSPTYTWKLNGSTVATTTNYKLDILSLTSGQNRLQLTVAYSGDSSYNAASVSSSEYLFTCSTGSNAQAGTYSSTCTARYVTLSGTGYAVFSISGTPSGSPYTRYSFRQSSSLSESSWGSSTYYRRYYIKPGTPSQLWQTMPYAKYSSGKWTSGGTSSAAWYNARNGGGVQVWITASSSKATRYFGMSSGVSVPN